MAKYYDEQIDKTIPWDGNDQTGGKRVIGTRVEEFLKGSLEKKIGILYYDGDNNRYLAFADEANRDAYLSDPERTDLVLGTFDAPYNYEARIYLETPTYNAISGGEKGNYIDYTFDVVNKSGQSTGEGVIVTYTFRRGSVTQTLTEQYAAGRSVHLNIDDYLAAGSNSVSIVLQGVTSLATTTAAITYQVVDLSLSSDLDISRVYDITDGPVSIAVPFAVAGYGTKLVEWYLDGQMLELDRDTDEVVDVSVARVKYITLANLSHGAHSLQIRAYTTINGEQFFSPTLYRDLLIVTGAKTDITGVALTIPAKYGIVSDRAIYDAEQYVPYTISFATHTYNVSATTTVTIKLGDDTIGSILSTNRFVNSYTFTPAESGDTTITLEADGDSISIATNVAKTTMAISEIINSLALDFRASGKSNSSTDRDQWTYGDFVGVFEGFNWGDTSGWVNGALHLSAGASLSINYAPLTSTATTTGKTIEIEFSSINVSDDNAILLDLRNSSGTGLLITASQISVTSAAGKTLETSYKDNETIRIAIVINRAAGAANKCTTLLYINGIISRATNWSESDGYATDVPLRFCGTSGAEMLLKSVRIYDAALTSDQILNNYTLYRETIAEMRAVYDRNNVYTQGTSNFDPETMASRLPVMIITGNIPVLENTTSKDEQIVVDIDYTNLQDPSRNFRWVSAALRPQGTSSMGYPKKNFRPYTQKLDSTIVYDASGNVVKDRLYSFKAGAQPVNCWCLKADYAESSGTHNTGIARLWNKILLSATINGEYVFRTGAQVAAINAGYEYDVRTTVDGFPVLLFYRLTSNDPLIFIGKYNFNNDKSTASVFGFEDIPGFDNSKMQCWEILNNGNPLALFKESAGFDAGWEEAFESRYPDTKTPYTGDLKALCVWMSSVSAEDFPQQKYEHFDVYKLAAYYIYLMRFGAADQLVKNAMLTSEDGVHFYFINYDNDTINGLTNEGKLVVPWDADRTTIGADGQPYYAGKDSNLWNLLEADDDFMSVVKVVDDSLYTAGLRYADVIGMFDGEQSSKWVERVYNQDAQYKYIGPYTERGIDNLFMLQGSRSSHRKYWLARRFSLFDSRYVSGAYKAASVELKCINNTPAGQQIKVTAGTAMDYGYGINNVARESNVSLAPGEQHTFVTSEVVNLGDPIRIYAAPNIRELDISAMADRLAVVTVDKVYDDAYGSKLTRLVVGSPTHTNSTVTAISGLSQARRLEYLDIRNMKGITALDLTGIYTIKEVDARGSSVASITTSPGSSLATLRLPDTMQVLTLAHLSKLTMITSDNSFSGIATISVSGCPAISKDYNFVRTWVFSAADTTSLSLTMDNVYWDQVPPEELIELGGIGHIKLRGQINVVTVTDAQVGELKELFGETCFTRGAELYINAPDGVYIVGPDTVVGGESAQLEAVVLSSYPGTIEWSIISGSGASIDSNGMLTTTGSTSLDRSVVVQARHIPTQGIIVYATKTITISKVVRPSSATITGADTVSGDTTYSLTVTPEWINKPYTVTWSLTGDGFDAGYVGIKESDAGGCTLELLSPDAQGVATLTATIVKDDGSSFFVQKSLTLGILFTLHILSNQGDDADIAAVQASVTYGSTTISVSSGISVGIPRNTYIKIIFPEVSGYKAPDMIEIVTGTTAMTESVIYRTEVCRVTLRGWDGNTMIGQIATINGASYTYDGTTIQHKIAHGVTYTVAVDNNGAYTQPSSQTFTSSLVARDVEMIYSQVLGSWITIDQTITDPDSMVTGDINGEHIQLIRANSHRYLAKQTGTNEMTICQLDDDDSNYYWDGSAATHFGEEGEIFMKLPRFWYRGMEVSTDVWTVGFYYGDESPGAEWVEWEGDELIGAVLATYSESQNPHKIMSIGSSVGNNGSSVDVVRGYVMERGAGFSTTKMKHHNIIALLFVAQYGTTNSQKILGTGRSNSQGIASYNLSFGMRDSEPTISEEGRTMSFWGLSKWYASAYMELLWNISRVGSDYSTKDIFEITDDDGSVRTVGVAGSNLSWQDYPAKMVIGEKLDFIPCARGGSATTGYCDMYESTSDYSKRTVGRGSTGADDLTRAGMFTIAVSQYDSYRVFFRLCFKGNIIINENVESFKQL